MFIIILFVTEMKKMVVVKMHSVTSLLVKKPKCAFNYINRRTTKNISFMVLGSSQNNLDDLDKNKESLIEKPSIICIGM